MSINVNDKNLGHATAYAYYKAGGGTMTEAEFTEFMADFGTASQTAVEAAQAALASKNAAQTAATTAANKATEATTAATTATNKAAEASTSASTATSAKDTAVSASQTATTKATEATTAAATATSAATTATTAKDDAVSAKTAAQTAQTGAETAAASVSASAAQIATNAEDISQLKSELNSFTTLIKSRNIWDETNRNGYYNTSGVFVSSANHFASYFIEVEPNTAYYWHAVGNRGRMCFYSDNTETSFLSSLSGTNATSFTTASNCHYIAFDMAGAYGNTYKHDICINVSDDKNGTYSAYFAPYYTVDADKVEYLESIADYYNENAKTVYGTNRFDPDDVVVGNLASGAIISTNTGWRTTGFIYVHDIQTLYFSCDYEGGSRGSLPLYFVTTYTEDQTYIEQAVSTSTSSPYTIPANAYWVRLSYQYDASAYEYMVEPNRALFSPQFKPYKKETVINKYSGYKWAVIGDSLTEGNSRTSLNYHDYIKESLGLTVLNYGASGTGYKRSEDQNKAFYQRVSDIDTSVDVVTIFGSGNDMQYVANALGDVTDTGTDTICGCFNTTIDNLYTIMPTVQIGIITPTPWKDYNPSNATNPMNLYANKLVELCKARGIPCLDLYHCSNLRPWNADFRNIAYVYDNPDGAHPSEAGHKLIASRIEEFIKSLLV